MSQLERWLKNYPVENTNIRYRITMEQFCKHFDVTPEETLTWSVDQAEDNLLDWKTSRLKTHAGSTIRLDFSVVRQWFNFNRIRVMVQCKNVSTAKTYLDYIPFREDVQRLLDAAKLHHKVAIGLLAFPGLRPIDVARLEFQNIKASYKRGEEVLSIVKQHKKSKEWYVGFVGPQAARYIRGFIEARKAKGEKITTLWDGIPRVSPFDGSALMD
jgi:integrase